MRNATGGCPVTPNIETETHDFIALPPPNGTLIDQWQSPLDWGWFDLPTKISLITGGGPDEHFRCHRARTGRTRLSRRA